tara:strand:+ start:446 stop:886 length:441 start_codon:yes stop_codon:yes gene_type:complete
MYRIDKVSSEKIRPLRHKALRQGKPYSTTGYLRDLEPDTLHLAVLVKKEIVTCATFYPEEFKKAENINAYRLRGMATSNEHRRKGYGKKIMKEAIDLLKQKKCDLLWCNARLVALDFYKSLGFITTGKIFEIKDIGPHYVMYKKIH